MRADRLALAACLACVAAAFTPHESTVADFRDQIVVPGGSFFMGTDRVWFAQDAEGPARAASVEPFVMDQFEVSNDRFAEFVEDTGYISEAHVFGWSFVHEKALSETVLDAISKSVQQVPWWLPVDNATWAAPEGVGSSIAARGSHPVLHVSHNDAKAFCAWAMPGGRLPTETEWERAARAGKENRTYAWGNLLLPKKRHRTNIWQGTFPHTNTVGDGHEWACPVNALGPQNRWGFHGVSGNVWEWTSDPWCGGPGPNQPPECRGKARPSDPGEVEYVKKGGSFLCHKDYCYRYRVAARTKNTANSAAYNIGIRCARDATEEERALVAGGGASRVPGPLVGNADAPSTAHAADDSAVTYKPGSGNDEL